MLTIRGRAKKQFLRGNGEVSLGKAIPIPINPPAADKRQSG